LNLPVEIRNTLGTFGGHGANEKGLHLRKPLIFMASPRRSDTYMVAQDELGYWLVSEVVIPFEGVI
jgi:hypothetical protein